MLGKKGQNNHSMIQKANQFGMALFVFVVLAGTILWLTGNLHFGPLLSAGPRVAVEGRHATDYGSQLNGEICHEHGVLESQCAVCNPGLPEPAANPSASDLAAVEKALCEHGIRTIECDSCRFELGVVRLRPAVANALIETAVAQNTECAEALRLTGQVQLDLARVVDVVPTGAGQVRTVEKLLGQRVEKGDVLTVIYSADLGQAKAQFLEIHARLGLATATLEREKELFEKKITSKADYLSALNELKAAQAYYEAAEQKMRLFGLAGAQIEAIKTEKNGAHFAELVLYAPQSGTIIAQNVSAGALVDATKSLYTIADLSNVWVWCDLYEKDLSALQERLSSGQKTAAKVTTRAFEEELFDGIVDLIGPQIDEHTRTIKVRVQVRNEEHKLKPGMFAKAEIAIPLKGSATTVPSTAILADGGKTFVFQHWKDDFWIRRDVRVGRQLGHFVEIVQGIQKGAEVVAHGAFMLKSDILRGKMGAGCAD